MEMVFDVAMASGPWMFALFCVWRCPVFLTQMVALLTAFRSRDAAVHKRFCTLLAKLQRERNRSNQLLE